MNDPVAFEDYCRASFSREKISTEFATPGMEFYLVYLENKLAGYLKLNLNRQPADWVEPGPTLQLERVYVSADVQSRGLGAALLAFTEARARAIGADWVWLSVWQKSPRSIAFYERNGYAIFGIETFWVGDDAQPDWLMRKKLS